MKKRVIFIKAAAMAGIAGCVGDFAALFVAAAYVPGYNHLRDTMSKLGTTGSPVSDQISRWWLVLGILMIFFGIGIRAAFKDKGKPAILASWLIILYGLGEGFGSGVFKADHVAGALTTSAIIHNIFGGIGVAAIAVFPWVMPMALSNAEMPGFQRLSGLVFILGLLTLSLFMMRYILPADNFIQINKGLWQRLFVMIYYLYLIVVSVRMIKIKPG